MIVSVLLSVLLANSAIAPVAERQSTPPPAAASTTQDPAEKPWSPAGVFRMDQGVTAPEVIQEVKPLYTAAAMRARIQGLVEVAAVIESDGTIGEVRVVRSLDKEFGLDEQAVGAIKQWEFKPGTKDGIAVPVLVKIELTFTLRR